MRLPCVYLNVNAFNTKGFGKGPRYSLFGLVIIRLVSSMSVDEINASYLYFIISSGKKIYTRLLLWLYNSIIYATHTFFNNPPK